MKDKYGSTVAEIVYQMGFKQSDFVKAFGWNRRVVSNWFTDVSAIPVYAVVDIADFVGCTTDELLGLSRKQECLPHTVYALVNLEGKRFLDDAAKMCLSNPSFRAASSDTGRLA